MSYLRARMDEMGKMYGIGKFADMLGVSISTLRRLEREGKIMPGRTPGGQRRWLLFRARVQTIPSAAQVDVIRAKRNPLGQRNSLLPRQRLRLVQTVVRFVQPKVKQ